MPLEPVPPPSPCGKTPPPPKDHCICKYATRMCDIPISQIGHRFHYVSRRFIDTVFFPPSIPAWVLRHLKAHPPKWTWTIRAGPRAGMTLTVPTIPIHCSSDSHKAIKWIVSVFHLFKSFLNREETAINREGRRILPQLVRIYQNNMLLHVAAQMRILERTPPTKATKDAPPPPSGPSPSKTASPPARNTPCVWPRLRCSKRR